MQQSRVNLAEDYENGQMINGKNGNNYCFIVGGFYAMIARYNLFISEEKRLY